MAGQYAGAESIILFQNTLKVKKPEFQQQELINKINSAFND
jgi:hypothetical protein